MQTKFRLSVRWLCFAVLLAAVVVRLAAQPGLQAHLVSVAAPTQAAEDAPEPAQDGSWPTLCYEPPSHDAPDLPAVTIDNRSGLPLEPDALPEAARARSRAGGAARPYHPYPRHGGLYRQPGFPFHGPGKERRPRRTGHCRRTERPRHPGRA